MFVGALLDPISFAAASTAGQGGYQAQKAATGGAASSRELLTHGVSEPASDRLSVPVLSHLAGTLGDDCNDGVVVFGQVARKCSFERRVP